MSEVDLINQAIEEYKMMMNYDDPDDLKFIRREIQTKERTIKIILGKENQLWN